MRVQRRLREGAEVCERNGYFVTGPEYAGRQSFRIGAPLGAASRIAERKDRAFSISCFLRLIQGLRRSLDSKTRRVDMSPSGNMPLNAGAVKMGSPDA